MTTYCPGFEKKTRARQQKYKLHMLVLGCAGTDTINCQNIEKNNTGTILDGLSRFFNEVCVPKICYPDKDGAIMKSLEQGDISILVMLGRLHMFCNMSVPGLFDYYDPDEARLHRGFSTRITRGMDNPRALVGKLWVRDGFAGVEQV